MWLELAAELKDESLVLQDSYDMRYWRDLASFDDVDIYKEGRRWFIPGRFYRAVAKNLDQPMDALAKARERWQASALTDYQYVYWNVGEFGLIEELVVVSNGKIIESYVVQQPERTFVDYDSRIADEEWSHEIVVPPGTASEALTRSRQLWKRANARDYQYHVSYQSNLAAWESRVEVSDGVAKFVTTSSTRPNDAVAATAEQLQELASSTIGNGSEVYFSYHPDSGLPTFISVDWTATFVDGPGQQLRITDFTEL